MEFNVLLIAISGYKYPVSTQKTVSDTLLCWETYTIWLEWQVLDILDHVIHLDKSLTPHGSSTCTPLGDHPGLIKRVGWNTNALFTKATEAFPWVAMWELVSNLSWADYSVFTQPYLFLRWYFPTIISTVVLPLSIYGDTPQCVYYVIV